VFVEEGTCAIAQSEPASKFTAHRAVVPAIAWLLLHLLLLMVVNMYKHMGKVVIKILQGSAVTITMLGGLTIYHPVANFLQCICAQKL